MTLAYFAGRRITGTAADRTGGTWTNLPAGWIFLETDTRSELYWSGTAWIRTGSVLYTSGRKFGQWHSLTEVGGDGLMANMTNVTGQTAASIKDITLGVGRRYTSTTTITTNAGVRMTSTCTIRGLNPHFRCMFRLGTITLQRMYVGFHTSGIDLTGDDPLNAQAGVMLGLRSADTNFQIFHNDTSGATVYDIDTGVAKDTGIHKIEIIGDDANSRFGWSLDGSAFSYTNLSADIPAQTTNLLVQAEIQTNESGVAKIIDIAIIELEHDSKWP